MFLSRDAIIIPAGTPFIPLCRAVRYILWEGKPGEGKLVFMTDDRNDDRIQAIHGLEFRKDPKTGKNEAPLVAATAAPGCELDPGEFAKPASSPVTYHRDVARILQQNCVSCHRDGGIAPFALDDIEEVEDRSRVIRRVVTEGTMPPWFAATADDKPSPWANDRSLSARDKADLLAWLGSSDRPLGDGVKSKESEIR
jgi:mono/diheme cytochrome c family protein